MDQPEPGPRLVVDALPEAGSVCRIGGEEAAHARARRIAVGAAVVLVDGSGREAAGRLRRVERGFVEVDVLRVTDASEGRPGPIHLLVAAVRPERLSWIAEKATEFGAARLTLVSSERTQGFRAAEAIGARLHRIVREAAKQAETPRWPEIAGPIALAEVLRGEPAKTRLILDPGGQAFPSTLPQAPTALLVGPEGGWTPAELEAALALGWVAVSLAAGKLRAETAAIAALTLVRTAFARPRPRPRA